MSRSIALALILLPVIILPLTACGGNGDAKSSARDAAKLNAHALRYLSEEKYETSVELLYQAVEAAPGDKTYIANLAFALYHAGRFDEAIDQYERALTIDPDDPLLYFDYGLCLGKAKRYREALPMLLKAVELGRGNSKFPDMLFELAGCHKMLGNREGVVSTLRRLVEVAPEPQCYKQLGDMLQDDGDMEGAEEAYREAINLSPHYTPAMNNLGLLLCSTSRKDDGRRFYRMVLDRDPDNHVAHNNLAMEYYEDSDLDTAINEIKLAIDVAPDIPLYHYHYAQFLIESGNNEDAISELQTTLQLDSGFTDAEEALEDLM